MVAGRDQPLRTDLLLVIDPLDDLFAFRLGRNQLRSFGKVLSVLLATGRVWVVATLRADLYAQFYAQPDLLALRESGALMELAPPSAAEASARSSVARRKRPILPSKKILRQAKDWTTVSSAMRRTAISLVLSSSFCRSCLTGASWSTAGISSHSPPCL